MESQKYNKLANITKKQTHRHREQISGYRWVGTKGDRHRVRGMFSARHSIARVIG